MLLAQAIVERGILDAMVAGVWSAVMRVNQFVGADDTKWWLIGAAIVLGYIFLKPRR